MVRYCLLRLLRSEVKFRLLHANSGNKRNNVEKPEADYFSGASQWRDHRVEKMNPKSPGFHCKDTQESMWLDDKMNSRFVTSDMVSVSPCQIQASKRSVREQWDAKTEKEKLWQIFFSDPTQWWDNTPEKDNPKFPDFKHKHTQESLWLVDRHNPEWIVSKIASIAPGTLQMHPFSWARKLSRCNKAKQFEETIELFRRMQQEGISADRFVFVPVLNACSSLRALEEGRRIHRLIMGTDCESDLYVSNTLIDMYAKCESMDDAWRVFNQIPKRTAVAWTAMIMGHVNSGQGLKALKLFQQMQGEGIEPDYVTFVALLKACASIASLEEGRHVHGMIIQTGCNLNAHVGNSLVDMYVKCGSIEDAWTVFNNMPKHDVVAWTAMMLGFLNCGQATKVLELFQQMQREGVGPNSFTFVGLLKACAIIGALEEGRHVHGLIKQSGCESEVHVGSSLIDMYAKCGSIDDAVIVFHKMPTRGVVAWNAMIQSFVSCGQGRKALDLFQQMHLEGIQPDAVTFLGLINACASIPALDEGKEVHEMARRNGCESDVCVGSSLVDMYAKCGRIDDAWRVFNKMPTRNLVTWNAIILGHVHCREGPKALELFLQMQNEGFEPDSITFVGLLNACASVAALDEGRQVHRRIRQSGCESEVHVGSSLVDMYAKCGSIEDAFTVFSRMLTPGVVAWTAMIGGYAMHGRAQEAIALFEEMFIKGIEINEVTFVCLLSACSHGGLVKEGMQYFESMRSVYGVSPNLEHYTHMVDLLGRAGHLDDAIKLVKTMPLKPDRGVWMSLLAACRMHGNVEMGEHAAEMVMELDPTNASGYVLLSNIYADAGQRDRSEMVHRRRLERSAWKQPGRTWIEVNKEMHSFIANDSKHPQIKDIHAEITRLSDQMQRAGHVPDTRFAFRDEGSKIDDSCHHSERLAIAFGLMSTPTGTPVLIVKNLRVCEDCHTFTKFIAKIVGRSITVRDANRFHQFKDGLCSCGDYW